MARSQLKVEDMGDRGDWNWSRIHSGDLEDMYQFLDGIGPRQRVWIIAHGVITEGNEDSNTIAGTGYMTLLGSTDIENVPRFRTAILRLYERFESVDFFDINYRTRGTRRKPSIPTRYR